MINKGDYLVCKKTQKVGILFFEKYKKYKVDNKDFIYCTTTWSPETSIADRITS